MTPFDTIPFTMLQQPLFAYLDPGAGSILLQALIGGGAGLYVFLKHILRMFRAGAFKPAQTRAACVAGKRAEGV